MRPTWKRIKSGDDDLPPLPPAASLERSTSNFTRGSISPPLYASSSSAQAELEHSDLTHYLNLAIYPNYARDDSVINLVSPDSKSKDDDLKELILAANPQIFSEGDEEKIIMDSVNTEDMTLRILKIIKNSNFFASRVAKLLLKYSFGQIQEAFGLSPAVNSETIRKLDAFYRNPDHQLSFDDASFILRDIINQMPRTISSFDLNDPLRDKQKAFEELIAHLGYNDLSAESQRSELHGIKEQKIILLIPMYARIYLDLINKGYEFEFIETPTDGNWEPVKKRLRELEREIDLDTSLVKFRECVILMNSPNNPTGIIPTQKDSIEFAKLMKEFPHMFAINDAIFSGVNLTEASSGIQYYSPSDSRYVDLNAANYFEISSISKAYPLAPIPFSYVKVPENIVSSYYADHPYGGIPSQYKARIIGELRKGPESLKESAIAYKKLLKFISDKVQEKLSPHVSCDPNLQSGNFLLLNFKKLEGKSFIDNQGNQIILKDDLAITKFLLEKANIGVVPGACFFLNPEDMVVRIAIAVPQADLETAINNIQRAIQEVQDKESGVPSLSSSPELTPSTRSRSNSLSSVHNIGTSQSLSGSSRTRYQEHFDYLPVINSHLEFSKKEYFIHEIETLISSMASKAPHLRLRLNQMSEMAMDVEETEFASSSESSAASTTGDSLSLVEMIALLKARDSDPEYQYKLSVVFLNYIIKFAKENCHDTTQLQGRRAYNYQHSVNESLLYSSVEALKQLPIFKDIVVKAPELKPINLTTANPIVPQQTTPYEEIHTKYSEGVLERLREVILYRFSKGEEDLFPARVIQKHDKKSLLGSDGYTTEPEDITTPDKKFQGYGLQNVIIDCCSTEEMLLKLHKSLKRKGGTQKIVFVDLDEHSFLYAKLRLELRKKGIDYEFVKSSDLSKTGANYNDALLFLNHDQEMSEQTRRDILGFMVAKPDSFIIGNEDTHLGLRRSEQHLNNRVIKILSALDRDPFGFKISSCLVPNYLSHEYNSSIVDNLTRILLSITAPLPTSFNRLSDILRECHEQRQINSDHFIPIAKELFGLANAFLGSEQSKLGDDIQSVLMLFEVFNAKRSISSSSSSSAAPLEFSVEEEKKINDVLDSVFKFLGKQKVGDQKLITKTTQYEFNGKIPYGQEEIYERLVSKEEQIDQRIINRIYDVNTEVKKSVKTHISDLDMIRLYPDQSSQFLLFQFDFRVFGEPQSTILHTGLDIAKFITDKAKYQVIPGECLSFGPEERVIGIRKDLPVDLITKFLDDVSKATIQAMKPPTADISHETASHLSGAKERKM